MKDIAKVEFGRKKLGDEEYARQAATRSGMVSPSGIVFGERKKRGGPAAPVAASAPEVTAPATQKQAPDVLEAGAPSEDAEPLTVAEIEEALQDDPSQFDALFRTEFLAGKPRKGAVRALLAVEKASATPRPQILKVLEGHS